MSAANPPEVFGPKEQVVRALAGAAEPLDAYQVAKVAGVTPIQAGRTLAKLAHTGVARTDDPLGTANDLSARYRLVEGVAPSSTPAG